MDKIDLDELRQKIAEETHSMATPIDYDDLIKKGLLKQRGKYYYTDDIHALPKHVKKKIKDVFQNGRYGIRVTFYNATKAIKKHANDFAKYGK